MVPHVRLQGTERAPSNPMDAAAAVIAAVPPNPLIEHMSVAPGGFINIRLHSSFINQGIADIVKVCYTILLVEIDYWSSSTLVQ